MVAQSSAALHVAAGVAAAEGGLHVLGRPSLIVHRSKGSPIEEIGEVPRVLAQRADQRLSCRSSFPHRECAAPPLRARGSNTL